MGRLNRLEVHHIFPRAQLHKLKYGRSEANALANFCFLTQETNLRISDRLPEEYFPKFEALHQGTLASQWIPMDPNLWKAANYLQRRTRQGLSKGQIVRCLKRYVARQIYRTMLPTIQLAAASAAALS